MKIRLLLFSLLISSITIGQNVHIKGVAKTYAGKNITFYKINNPILDIKKIIKKIQITKTGNFSFRYKTNKIEKIYIDADYFKAYIYVYPNFNNTIILPKYKTKPKGDIYFQQVELPALIKDSPSNELNNKILQFDNDLERLIQDKFSDIIKHKTKLIEIVEDTLNNKYKSKNKYFNIYKKYKIAQNLLPIYTEIQDKFIKKHFKNIYLEHPEYTNLIKNSVINTLSYSQFKNDKNISPNKLIDIQRKQLRKIGITNKRLQNYILAISFYKNSFHPVIDKSIFTKSLRIICANDNYLRPYYLEIKKTSKQLIKGYTFPNIIGENIQGKKKSLKQYNDKFCYLFFFRNITKLMSKDLEILQRLNNRKYLEILLICDKNRKEYAQKVMRIFNLQSKLLLIDNFEEHIKRIGILDCPSYFLIDKKRKIINPYTIKPGSNLYKEISIIDREEQRESSKKTNRYF